MNFLEKRISGCFTIPSGIVTTDARVIERVAQAIPEIGVITTKSVGLAPRAGYAEPILTQYAPGCFMNAVGLTNPGAEAFAEHLRSLKLPPDRFLLTSIFGGNAEEFAQVAAIVAPDCDGVELNLSCPHAAGYGMAIGQDPQLVREITRAVKQAVNIPVIPKLTPNVPNIVEIAKAAVEGGADALCAVNTVGPGYYTIDGQPVLTNRYGGMSGKGILPIGLKCVQQIAQAVNVPIIGCGGIFSADDVRAYRAAGATIFSIGSAVAGLSLPELQGYFHAIADDLDYGTNHAAALLKTADMTFRKYRVVENQRHADDLSILIFDNALRIQPGQFVFVWIPGVGEKPFSALNDQPLTLYIQKRGCFTEKLCQLQPGNAVYVRGPYGMSVTIPKHKKPVFVCGGSGLAAVYQIARENSGAELFIGARDAQHLCDLDKVREVVDVHIATDDGSSGY